MEPSDSQIEQKLEEKIKAAIKLRDEFSTRVAIPGGLADAYRNMQLRLRELNMWDPKKGEPNPKEFIRAASSSSLEARQAIAFKGPSDGVSKSLMKNIPALQLSQEDSLTSAILCILEDFEQTFPSLPNVKLPPESELLAILAALKNHPVIDFEDFKIQEVMYSTATTQDPREMAEIKRRFEQVRGKKIQHVRKHAVNYIPQDLKENPHYLFLLLRAALTRDVFGTLEAIKEASSSEDQLKSTTGNLFDKVSTEEKMELLEIPANLGMGLASTYLNIFNIPDEVEWDEKLQYILKRDVTAGHSLFGAFAFESVQNYPFELERIEINLPRRISNAEAADYLKRNDDEDKPRTYSGNEIADTAAVLQERDVKRFVENLKADIGRNWKSCVGDQKRSVVFGDMDLKVRDLLFLVVSSLFEPEEKFEKIIETVQKSHPVMNATDPAKTFVLANRYYFLDLIGLSVDFLYNRTHKPNGSTGTQIEDVSDYYARNLMHLGMSIYIRVGDVIFRGMPVAWNMLVGQCEGKIDHAFQEVGHLFDAFDTLLTIIDNAVENMSAWAEATLLDAVSQDLPNLSFQIPAEPKKTQLRVTTVATIAKAKEALNRYCLDALYYRADAIKATPIAIIQTLKIPRGKTDKLRILLTNDSAAKKAAAEQAAKAAKSDPKGKPGEPRRRRQQES